MRPRKHRTGEVTSVTGLVVAGLLLAAAPAAAGDDGRADREGGSPGAAFREHVPWGPRGPGGAGGGPLLRAPLEGLQEALDLQDRQVEALLRLRRTLKEGTRAERKELARLHEQMHALWTSGKVPSRGEILALRRRMGEVRERLFEKAVDAGIEALGVLTEEQRRKLGDLFPGHGSRSRQGPFRPFGHLGPFGPFGRGPGGPGGCGCGRGGDAPAE